MSKKEQIEFINSVLATQDTYKAKSKSYLTAIQQNNKEVIAFIISLASAILPKKKNYDAMIYLNALRLVKEGVDQNNDDFLQKVQNNLLSTYVELGKFRIKDTDDTRGRFFFSDKPDKQLEIIGNSCLRLILECLMMWPQLYPVDAKKTPTKFRAAYEGLVKGGVTFPKEVNYFKKKNTKDNKQQPTNTNVNASQERQGGSGLQNPKNNAPPGTGRIKQIEEKLEESRNYKDLLLNILSVNNEAEMEQENLAVIGEYFERSDKQNQANLNYLLNEGTQEKLLAQLFMDQEFAQDFLNDLQNYRTKVMKFNDFKTKYVTLINKENQTPTPNQQQPPEENNHERQGIDEEAAQMQKQELQNSNQILRDKELSQPNIHSALRQEGGKLEDDDSPVLEKNDGFLNNANVHREVPEKKSGFLPREEEEKYQPQMQSMHSEENIPQEQQHVGIKKSALREEEEEPNIKNKPNSRRDSQTSARNNAMKQSDRLPNNDLRNSEKNLPSNGNFRSEYVEKNQPAANPYGFRSVVNKKEPSPMRPAVQKLFEIDENYRIETKKSAISHVMPRNEEKLSQILNAKDYDRFSENSEKPRSEVFDFTEFKRENQLLKEENQELKGKLAHITNNYKETEEVLEVLRKENQILQEKHTELPGHEHEEELRREFENQENLIEKLKHNNEILRAENEALQEHIRAQELEADRLRRQFENKGPLQGRAEDFEALEMLKKENEALRNFLNENRVKEQGDKGMLDRLMQENQELKVHLQEMQKLKPAEGDFRGSAMSRENFEFEEPKIMQNLPQGNASKKFMNNNNNASSKHWVQSGNNDFPPEERKEISVSPHKRIFEKAMPANTDELKRSVEVGSEKKRRSNEASHNQSMEESAGHPRLSNYLKRSAKMSRNESQKSAHTDQNKSFEEDKVLAGLIQPQQQQQPRLIIKPSAPYEGPRNFEENFDTNSVLNASLMSISQVTRKFEESPYQSDLIYPFQKPSDYYQGKKAGKQIKGFLIPMEKGGMFDEIEKQLRENSFRFKIACLRSKALLFDNGTLQLGLISGLYQYNEKSLLKLTLYFGNLTKYELAEFKVLYSGSSAISLWTKPDLLPSEVSAKSQAKQDLLIDINSVPYPFIMARVSLNYQGNPLKFSVPIPMTLNKFLQPKMTDAAGFKYRWKGESSNLFKSETLDLNPRIAKSVYDFKKYLPNLIDLTPHKEYDYVSGVEDYKLCGIFEVGNGNLEVLMKVITQPNKKALFQVACKNAEIAEFLIRTMVFLFRN